MPMQKAKCSAEAECPQPGRMPIRLPAAKKLRHRRAARRERRAALMRALSEHLSEAFVGLARFLWQYAWVFAMPLAVALAAALASYSPADPSFSVSTARAPVNLCGLWGRGRRICSLACLVFPLGGSCSVWP